MLRDLRAVWALLAGVLLLAVGNGLQGSLVGVTAARDAAINSGVDLINTVALGNHSAAIACTTRPMSSVAR